jgi:hypothetical protein
MPRSLIVLRVERIMGNPIGYKKNVVLSKNGNIASKVLVI